MPTPCIPLAASAVPDRIVDDGGSPRCDEQPERDPSATTAITRRVTRVCLQSLGRPVVALSSHPSRTQAARSRGVAERCFNRAGPGTSSAMKTAVRTILLVALVAAAPLIASVPRAAAAPVWAPAATAAIHPGVQTFTAGAQCTANFVFYSGTTVYLGQAAHCSGTGAATETDGCTSSSLPVGTPVDVGGVATGTMAYNSWITMQASGETNPDVCAYNDLALIRLSPADAARVNPSIPFWGGPTGVSAAAPRPGRTCTATGTRPCAWA